MRTDQQPAYVLHARPYRETSLLLECVTREYGRLGVIARGVRGERARLRRAQLEPFQLLAMDLLLRGELATLTAAETTGAALRMTGDVAMAGLYLNELMVRLTERQDPAPTLFDAYAQALDRLAAGQPLAWTLRRFERDLLEAIGYGLQLQYDGETGEPLVPEARYRYLVEQGPVATAPVGASTVSGSGLLALQQDRMPDGEELKPLRGMMREVIRFHLGGKELRSWRVLGAPLSGR